MAPPNLTETIFVFLLVISFLKTSISCHKILIPDLPKHHYQYWLRNNPGALRNFESICSQITEEKLTVRDLDDLKHFNNFHTNLTFENSNYNTNLSYGKQVLEAICAKIEDVEKSCWGYENKCEIIHLMPECSNPPPKWADNVAEQKIKWFQSADFGYVGERRKELERYCSPNTRDIKSDTYSSLECSKHFTMCRGKNLFIDFRSLPDQIRDGDSFLKRGMVGGWNCDLQRKRIQQEGKYKTSLQSWFNELGGYELLDGSSSCDVTIDKPAYIMKLDATTNMYHHFCDFVNLYATVHMNNSFSMDNRIVIWDTRPYKSNFGPTWAAFSKNPITDLSTFNGKRVCFKDFVFPLLPRLVDGIYYGTPLIPGCTKSGLFDAFNKHILHKLKIPQHFSQDTYTKTNNELIRVRLLIRSRNQRKILNAERLVQSLRRNHNRIDVKLYNFDNGRFNFTNQLEIVHNTDILVGIHGAGLTHALFLPDWASVFELYNSGDENCYKDLARLRGVQYYTWRNETKMTAHSVEDVKELQQLRRNKVDTHKKFKNYSFDPEEFVKIIEDAIEGVKVRRASVFKKRQSDNQKFETRKEPRRSLTIENPATTSKISPQTTTTTRESDSTDPKATQKKKVFKGESKHDEL